MFNSAVFLILVMAFFASMIARKYSAAWRASSGHQWIVRLVVWWMAARAIADWTGAGVALAALAGIAVVAIFEWSDRKVARST